MDLFWPGVCIVEMKRPSEAAHLERHREQALAYWQKSGTPRTPAPRYVVLCAFHRFEVWEPGAVYTEPRAVVDLVDLPENLDVLNFLAGRQPVFEGGGAELTREAVALVTELNQRLRDRKAADLPVLRDFLLQSVWAMFAEDLHMLPSHVFTRVVQELASDASRSSADDLGRLFEILATKGPRPEHGTYEGVPYANGSLFDRPARVHLEPDEVELLAHAAGDFNWRDVEPAISSAGCCRARSAGSGNGRSAPTTRTRPTSSRSSCRRSSSPGASGSPLAARSRTSSRRRTTSCITSCSTLLAARGTSSTSPIVSCVASKPSSDAAKPTCAGAPVSASSRRSPSTSRSRTCTGSRSTSSPSSSPA